MECETCMMENGFHDSACWHHPSQKRIRELEQEINRLKNPQKWPKQWKGKVPFCGKTLIDIGIGLGLEGKTLGMFVKAFKDVELKLEVTETGRVTFYA